MFFEAMLAASLVGAKTPDVKSSSKQQTKKQEEQPYYKAYDPNVDVTPSARTCSNVSGPFVTGSYLYWQAKVDNIPIVALNHFGSGNSFTEIKEMDFDWTSGFKAGIGYNLKRDGWDIFLNWTHINPRNHQIFNRPSVVNGFPDLIAFLSDTVESTSTLLVVCDRAETKFSLKYNVLDLELGRHFFIGRNLSLRPFAGLKGVILFQHLKVNYFGDLEINTDVDPLSGPVFTIPFDVSKQTAKQNDHDIGPRVGINSRWNLTQLDFGILANASFSLLWNKIKLNQRGQVFDFSNPDNNRDDLVKQKKTVMQPVFELFLGLDWRRCFMDWLSLEIAAGYEMQFWPNESHFAGPETLALSRENLSLQGLTASVKLDF